MSQNDSGTYSDQKVKGVSSMRKNALAMHLFILWLFRALCECPCRAVGTSSTSSVRHASPGGAGRHQGACSPLLRATLPPAAWGATPS